MTTVTGSPNTGDIKHWARWIEEPIDQQLLAEVRQISKPVRITGHLEGLAKNN